MTRIPAGPVPAKLAAANKKTTLFCQIETAEGVKNADAIAAVDGVDCLWVGHFDLSVSLGIPASSPTRSSPAPSIPWSPPATSTRRRWAGWCRMSETGNRLLQVGLRFHLLFRRCLGVAERADRGGHQKLRGRVQEAVRVPWQTRSASHCRVDFKKADGSPTFPDFDTAPLKNAPGVELAYIDASNPIHADQLADFDALILLAPRFARESIHPKGRLSVVARFGVGL